MNERLNENFEAFRKMTTAERIVELARKEYDRCYLRYEKQGVPAAKINEMINVGVNVKTEDRNRAMYIVMAEMPDVPTDEQRKAMADIAIESAKAAVAGGDVAFNFEQRFQNAFAAVANG